MFESVTALPCLVRTRLRSRPERMANCGATAGGKGDEGLVNHSSAPQSLAQEVLGCEGAAEPGDAQMVRGEVYTMTTCTATGQTERGHPVHGRVDNKERHSDAKSRHEFQSGGYHSARDRDGTNTAHANAADGRRAVKEYRRPLRGESTTGRHDDVGAGVGRYNHFIVDSGASHSVCCDPDAFTWIDYSRKVVLYSGGNARCSGSGVGSIDVIVADETGQPTRLVRHGVVYAASFQVSLLSLRKELVDFSSTVSFSHQPGQNSSITLADGKKVPFFDDGKNYKLPYITHDTYMMTSKGAGTRASPAGVYALRKVEEWKPEMLWHHGIGHTPLNVVGQLEKHATSVHDDDDD